MVKMDNKVSFKVVFNSDNRKIKGITNEKRDEKRNKGDLYEKNKRFKYRIIKNSINANDYNTSFSIMIPGENKFISLVMLSGGKIAVIIYILIMGYYSGKSKFNIAKPINIILKVIIYSILFMIILKSGNILDWTILVY